jgi:hypothetical protein
VQVVSWTYLNNGTAIGDIPSMLAVLLQKDVLTQYAVPKLRRPFDLLTATLRGVQAEVDPGAVSGTNLLRELREDLELMGMHPQYWGPPDGPADSQAWSQGGLLSRWNYQSKLADNGAPEVANFTVGVGGLLDLVGATAAEAAQGLNELLTGGRMEPKEVAAGGQVPRSESVGAAFERGVGFGHATANLPVPLVGAVSTGSKDSCESPEEHHASERNMNQK